MNGSPAICAEKRVQRAQSTQRSRSSSTCEEMLIGLGKVRLTSSKRVSPRPLLIAWFCSGHSPPLSQTGQSSGWLMSSSSITPCCALSATGEVSWVLTTMPSATGGGAGGQRLAAGPRPRPGTAGRRRPGRAAGGRRTAGSGCRSARRPGSPGCPWARAASKPSMVRRDQVVVLLHGGAGVLSFVTVIGTCPRSLHARSANSVEAAGSNGQPPWSECARYSSRKYCERRRDRAGRAVAERAERRGRGCCRRCRAASRGPPPSPGAAALLEPAQDLHQPEGALAARRALAARLVRVELGPAQRRRARRRSSRRRSAAPWCRASSRPPATPS